MGIHDGKVVQLPLVDFQDTKANIVAIAAPEVGMVAVSSDTGEIGFYSSGAWHWMDTESFTLAVHLALGDTAPHHVRYADGEAVSAMGVKADSNPLNHDRYTDGEALAAVPDASLTVKGKVELATNGETQTGTDAVRAVTPAGLRADAPVSPAASRIVRLDSAGVLHSPNSAWRIGDEVLNMDFTGTAYNTKAKCQAAGLRFSDSDSPFPNTLWNPTKTGGTWSHVSGNGWKPGNVLVTGEGPGLLLPLMRSGNWEYAISFRVFTRSASYSTYFHIGAIGIGMQIPIYTWNYSFSWQLYHMRAYVNDGDGTWTPVRDGVNQTSAGVYDLRLRMVNGVVGAYDDYNNTWYYYQDKFGGYIPYPVTHVFAQASRRGGSATLYHTLYVTRIKLTYLL